MDFIHQQLLPTMESDDLPEEIRLTMVPFGRGNVSVKSSMLYTRKKRIPNTTLSHYYIVYHLAIQRTLNQLLSRTARVLS